MIIKTDVIDNNNERFIGVYLYNESNFDVLADIKMTLGGKTMALQKQFLREKECIGENLIFSSENILIFLKCNQGGHLSCPTMSSSTPRS